VSPSWRDRVSVFLGPGEVHLARRARGWRPPPDIAYSMACGARAGKEWEPALAALGQALARLAWRNADARVTVSNHFVRYALVPAAGKLRGENERTAAARHALRTTYGERGESWRVVLGETYGGDALAAAIEPALADGLATALEAAGLRPAAIEPYLAAAFNACRGAIGHEPAWLAAAEPGRVCVAHLVGGAWRQVRNERLRGRLEDELAAVLERCRLSAGAEAGPGRVFLVSRDDASVEPTGAAGWSFERVRLEDAAVTPLAA
jgi:hypothetical protein